jgi:hypothetical protein
MIPSVQKGEIKERRGHKKKLDMAMFTLLFK